MKNKKTCPLCFAGTLKEQNKTITYSAFGESVSVEQKGMYCNKCGEGILQGKDILKNEPAFIDFQKRVRQKQGEEIKRIRKKLKLSQKDACILFGGGVNAFSRYENGKISPPLSLHYLFQILNKQPELLNEIKKSSKQWTIQELS